MKNLKLFVAPLLGAALFVTACGSKPMDVKDFRAKVQEKFNLNNIQTNYVGKKQHTTGGAVYSHPISGVVLTPIPGGTGNYYTFTFGDGFSSGNYDVLSTELIDNSFEQMKQAGSTVDYYISGDTYTIELKIDQNNQKITTKYVYNKDLVITSNEVSSSGSTTFNTHLDYKYE